MKSVIKNNVEDKQEELVFPVLMELLHPKAGKLIVLFTNTTEGTCMVDSNGHWNLGEWCNDYLRATDETVWKKFTGTIELSN